MTHRIPLCLALLAAACTSTDPSGAEPRGHQEAWVGEQIRGASIDQAILSQRTVFPYHFHPRSARLNELGRRDLAVLGRGYREEPGEISVRRAGASEELHHARVEAVMLHLAERGIDLERMSVVDAPPDGGGIAGDRLVEIFENTAPLGGAGGAQ